MDGIRFYLEFPNATAKKRSGKFHKRHIGNVFAAFVANGYQHGRFGLEIDGIGAVFDHPNSPVAGTAYNVDLLRKRCKRISEAYARVIHPTLFVRLDADTAREHKATTGGQ